MAEITIEIDDEIADEVGYALIGRATDIHDNPDDEYEWVAEKLRDEGQRIAEKYK